MRNSDVEEREVPPLTDADEHRRNLAEIKNTLLTKAFGFEDILNNMSIARPDRISKVTFNDFAKVVMLYCGPSKFSSF